MELLNHFKPSFSTTVIAASWGTSQSSRIAGKMLSHPVFIYKDAVHTARQLRINEIDAANRVRYAGTDLTSPVRSGKPYVHTPYVPPFVKKKNGNSTGE